MPRKAVKAAPKKQRRNRFDEIRADNAYVDHLQGLIQVMNDARVHLRLTIREVAARTRPRLSYTTVYNLLTGKTIAPQYPTIVAVARVVALELWAPSVPRRTRRRTKR